MTKCLNCGSINIYQKMATSRPYKESHITKHYFICKKCKALNVNVSESAPNRAPVLYDEVYLKEDVDYVDVNTFHIKKGAKNILEQ